MGPRGRKNKAGTQVTGLLCKVEKTSTFLELQRVMEDPLTLVERRGGRGATWCHQDKGLGAKGICYIKRGVEVGLLPS